MAKPILEMQGIGKRFPGVIALGGVDFSVRPGEVVALAGENGAGKSTLMKILGGVYQPDDGKIFVDGKEVAIRSVSDASLHGIGFVHQELNVLDNLTAAENVYLGREPKQFGFLVDRAKLNADAEVFLKRLGLDIPGKTPLRELSIAQQQMVELAKALSLNARILIMDEPTSSLTLTETERLLEVIKDLRNQGVSIIYISHRLGEIKEIADRVVVLRDGKNAGVLERDEISHDAIVKMMVGRDIERHNRAQNSNETSESISVKNLRTRRYPNNAISFEVRKGEILGFAGLVGAGRSDAAQAIFGVDVPVSGTVHIDDKVIRISSANDAIRNGIFLIPEDRRNSGLILDIPIRENITLPALSRYSSSGLVSKAAETTKAKEMCERLNVKAPSVESKAANLSGGNQQKVVLAKWLSLEPKLLIFDEPTRGIDVGAKSEIYQLMRDLAKSGVAIVMISSDMEEVIGESDRVAVMHEGSITGILDREDASEEAIMRLAVGHA
ncbi:MAG TPA: sugar ABC transporter ATP-binding protein [Pyrinomonadaceae bacterium]|nr:sugar ABC transporter ATP-binding protein [Acidobacteriota bacterium]HQZ96155.1 sugar ABC transporter ATP-binding protein [Pyrinomonadaceae bacterium]